MRLTVELSEIINLKKNDDEKSEIYTHVFKYKETDDEFYYYVVYKYYQEGRGHIVLSSKRGLIPKEEAVNIAYIFLTHNGTITAVNKDIADVRKRDVSIVNKILESVTNCKEIIFKKETLLDSYEKVVRLLQLQIKNTEKVKEIYDEIIKIEKGIQKHSHTLTQDLWSRGRELLQEYTLTMYEEGKAALRTMDSAEEIISYLENLKVSFLESMKVNKAVKQLNIMFDEKSKIAFLKTIEGFEKHFQGNYFTNRRGELTSEEYKQITNNMMEKEYRENLLKDNRNPEF